MGRTKFPVMQGITGKRLHRQELLKRKEHMNHRINDPADSFATPRQGNFDSKLTRLHGAVVAFIRRLRFIK
jgi:hypothetical protein